MAEIKLSLITCTGDRPEAFSLCERWMARQTIKYHQWLCLDDGSVPVVPTMGQTHVWCHEFNSGHSINRKFNYLITEGLVTGDAIVFIEDDDWYAPTWLEWCSKKLTGDADLIGEGMAIYYNVSHRYTCEHGNTEHSSLCSSVIKRSGFGQVLIASTINDAFLDQYLWFSAPISKRTYLPERKRLVVGIKGMPGRKGYGICHDASHPGGNPDIDGKRLIELLGKDAQYYLPYFNK